MYRETVKMPDDIELVNEYIHGSRNDVWEYIEAETISVDLDKGIEDIRVILKRKIDSKLFAFEYASTNYHSLKQINEWPLKGKEVFEKIIQTKIYE